MGCPSPFRDVAGVGLATGGAKAFCLTGAFGGFAKLFMVIFGVKGICVAAPKPPNWSALDGGGGFSLVDVATGNAADCCEYEVAAGTELGLSGAGKTFCGVSKN